MAGIGPATSPLPSECSTTEPHGRVQILNIWSGRRGSNSRHLVWKTNALPAELHPHTHGSNLHVTSKEAITHGGGGRIRTFVLRENGFTVRRL